MRKALCICILLLLAASPAVADGRSSAAPLPDANKLLQAMTVKQKVGQLFIIRPDDLDATLSLDEINDSKAAGVKELTPVMERTLKEYPAGGFALFKKNIATPEQLRRFTADLRAACHLAPVMAIDEEGGRIARIANSKGFTVSKVESMEAIGNTKNPERAREAASTIGRYLAGYGFTMDFAPVADVNTNPENIIIGDRAFGSDPERVSKMVSAYLDGLHEQGIIGSVKHFPGHGDTRDDTHDGTVVVGKTWDELRKAELIPFCENFAQADSIMVAHITLPKVTHDGLPASLSRELITGKLREELGYDGVVITDALMMGAVAKNYTPAEAAVLAVEAGNDILLIPWDYQEAFNGVLDAVQSGRISEGRLDGSVLRILKLKGEVSKEVPYAVICP
ncbi:MAG: glycoside hydrolase family 3 protein [Fretibacterium sp.]|nr:glycoside hydrolase family 3 protein [Fretibacterium sp.]